MKTELQDGWLIIVNPAAASGKVKKNWDKIKSLLDEHINDYKVVFTNAPKHAIQLTIDGIGEGYRKIIAVGGDGTNNEVANGIFSQQEVPTNEIIYSLLPVGTGNDWVKTHKIPQKLTTCLTYIKQMKTSYQDVGLVYYHKNGVQEKRYFVNVAGMAYDAFIAEYIEDQKQVVSNKFLYLFLVLKCLFKYDFRKAKVTFDGEVVEDYFHLINVGICRYSGGGMQLVPHAIADDGMMAMTLARKLPKLKVIFNTAKLYNGKINQLKEVSTHYAKHIKVESTNGKPTQLEVDGEYLGETPVEYQILEKSLQIIVP